LIGVELTGSGIAAATKITESLKNTAVVMLADSRDGDNLLAALRAGASGYLLEDMDPDRLPLALKGVLAGEVALPRKLTARLVDEFRQRTTRRFPIEHTLGVELTAREWDVLELMRDGRSTLEIATRLFISPATVRTHIASVIKKLNVPDRKSAVKLANGSHAAKSSKPLQHA
jgi:DNA-binding NarL/FixJ family response regulator